MDLPVAPLAIVSIAVFGISSPLAGQAFTLEANPEEVTPMLSLSTGDIVPTLASVQARSQELEARVDLTEAEREMERARLQRDYDIAIRMLEAQKASEQRKEEAARQGATFSREFLQLDMADPGFAEKFAALEQKYPLASEEPLSSKLIERAKRFVARQNSDDQDSNAPIQPER